MSKDKQVIKDLKIVFTASVQTLNNQLEILEPLGLGDHVSGVLNLHEKALEELSKKKPDLSTVDSLIILINNKNQKNGKSTN